MELLRQARLQTRLAHGDTTARVRPRAATRRQRAPKPLSVPVVVAAVGILVFFLGALLDSVDVSALGALFFFWGVCSFSFLALGRKRRAMRLARKGR